MRALIRPLLVLTLLATGTAYPQESSPAAPAWQPDPALSAEDNGHALYALADAIDSGFVDMEVGLRMILHSKKGEVAQRALRLRQLEVPDDGDKVLLVFDTPVNVRGTALLSHGHQRIPDDQWLFLPALQRVKKVASRNKSGPFLGSEFSFEDLAPPELTNYTYRYEGADTLDGEAVYIVTRYPTDEYSGYTREVVWLDQQHLRIRRVDYFDRSDRPLKQLTAMEYQLHRDRFWKPGRMLMDNLRTGRSTELVWVDYQFGRGFTAERDFSVTSLRRAR